MFGENPVDGRNPIGTTVTRKTSRIDSQAAVLMIERSWFTLLLFTLSPVLSMMVANPR
jgi:hypothetical protein